MGRLFMNIVLRLSAKTKQGTRRYAKRMVK